MQCMTKDVWLSWKFRTKKSLHYAGAWKWGTKGRFVFSFGHFETSGFFALLLIRTSQMQIWSFPQLVRADSLSDHLRRVSEWVHTSSAQRYTHTHTHRRAVCVCICDRQYGCTQHMVLMVCDAVFTSVSDGAEGWLWCEWVSIKHSYPAATWRTLYSAARPLRLPATR